MVSWSPTIHPIESPSDRLSIHSYWDANQILCWRLRHLLYSKPLQRESWRRWRGRRPRYLFCGGGQRSPPLWWLWNKADVETLDTMFVLRVSKTGRTVGRTDSRLDGWSGDISEAQNFHTCPARPSCGMLSIPSDIKTQTKAMAASELPRNPQVNENRFENF